jgi:hypothetical protein
MEEKTLQEQFQDDLFGGEQIANMRRNNTHFMNVIDETTCEVLFENGNLYKLSGGDVVSKSIYEENDFITYSIVKAINSFIEANPILRQDYNYSISTYDGIEVCGYDKEKSQPYILIRLIQNDLQKILYISNILIPRELKYRGFGKRLLNVIFEITAKFNYRLILVEMVESFYNKMLNRGAKVIIELDQLEIVSTTRLE